MAKQLSLKAPLQTPKPPSPSSLTVHSSVSSLPFPHSNLKLHFTKTTSEPEPIMFGPSHTASDSPKTTVKFLCSYGGKILPRYPDGKLRYLGGHTRVLVVDRSVPFSELLSKLEELCGSSVTQFRCQLPAEDLDALVSITSDEDLNNLIEEYDRASPPPLSLKIRTFLWPPRSSIKVPTPPSKSASYSSSSSASSSSSTSSYCSLTGGGYGRRYTAAPAPVPALEVHRCVTQMSPQTVYSGRNNIPLPRYGYHAQGNNGHIYLIQNGNHWQ